MNDFTLNGNAPYQHAHSADFRPPSPTAMLRQSLVNHLSKHPGEEIPLPDLAKAVGAKYSRAYAQAKFLCLKGFAVRSERQKYRETKDGKVPAGKDILLTYVVPFSQKIGPGLDAQGQVKKSLW